MVTVRGLARVGMLAVGLGIGAAVVSTPGLASADASNPSDWSWIDSLSGVAVPAESPGSSLDLAISIDGYSLVSDGNATATSGSGDIAIAYGDGASASAQGGTGDVAFADGSGAYAGAGGLSTDTGANDDTAIDIGSNTGGGADGAYAGSADLLGDSGTGSGDTAIDIGNNTNTNSESGAFALDGDDNYASTFGDDSVTAAGTGNDNVADVVGANSDGSAGEGDGNVADVVGSDSGAGAYSGNDNVADVVGPDSSASAGEGNNDIGYVFDPFGTDGSSATAGFDGNSDLSAVFGDGLTSTYATGGDYLYDILSPAGEIPGTAAATSGGFLAELLSLF